MSAQKTERLLNLLIMLLVSTRFVPKSRIREILYADAGDEAFDKMFDRDKEELRSLGVPVEVGQIDVYFDDEPGYRIQPDEFALPQIDLAADEAAVVGLATRVWDHQRLARATTEAVRKLSAAGAEIDLSALDIAQPRLPADEPTFDVFFEAILDRSVVEFDYWRTGTDAPARRRLQPWGVTRYSGRWYVVGLDLDRDDERVFRLSRVQGEARKVGRPGAYSIPEGTDISAATRRLAPDLSTEPVVLLVRDGAALPLRRAAETVEAGVPGPDGASTWDRLTLTRASVGIADEVLGFGDAVCVESPSSLRDQVVARLRAVVAR
ncbi:YafY family protein [Nocardioides sp.]|uniref:helix-turn-helix transcriptional regulator n=1 Tax=Nocardioides sp. TaxID=35761 RepID=UPI00271B76FF|nr:WYL domain-containing protein [Nocardioides sp.]MDO9454603.1 WYL domain-containing protein [Nocardioides sp.]